VRAGLAIQRALAQYAQDVEAAYGIKLTARIGVNTGEVVFSPEVHDGEVRYNALGDAVNVAARLQQLADDGGVVVGPTTQRQIEGCFELEELGERELKGKQAPVASYRVTGVREQESAPPKTPLIGREFELTVLEHTMDALVEGRGAIVSVTGEPGIGKTRLVQEVRSRYRDRIRFIEGRGVSYAQNFPYWPIRDLLREWLGVGATTPEARVRLELKAELAHLFSAEDAEEAYPFSPASSASLSSRKPPSGSASSTARAFRTGRSSSSMSGPAVSPTRCLYAWPSRTSMLRTNRPSSSSSTSWA
jgi:hypothetical protein